MSKRKGVRLPDVLAFGGETGSVPPFHLGMNTTVRVGGKWATEFEAHGCKPFATVAIGPDGEIIGDVVIHDVWMVPFHRIPRAAVRLYHELYMIGDSWIELLEHLRARYADARKSARRIEVQPDTTVSVVYFTITTEKQS